MQATLNAIDYGISGDKMQTILWQCQNLSLTSNLQNHVIICATNNIQQNSLEDNVDGIVAIALSLRHKYH